jgi:hypothetical protein
MALPPFFLGRTNKLGHEEDNGFENNSLASFHCWEGGGRGEKTACQLYAGLCGKVLEEVVDPLERRLTLWERGWERESVCFERGGWDSTTDTSGQSGLS